MYHRMVTGTGLGNPNEPILSNNWTTNDEINNILRQVLWDGISKFFKDDDGIDFQFDYDQNGFCLSFGIEPTYQFEDLKVISINKNKEDSFITTGKAWGVYGSNVVKRSKHYKDYTKKSKFIKFVDVWHKYLSEQIATREVCL